MEMSLELRHLRVDRDSMGARDLPGGRQERPCGGAYRWRPGKALGVVAEDVEQLKSLFREVFAGRSVDLEVLG